ncbi:hypothetical protein BN2475_190140 [Paraburkholderia ribeironis]|uniref:Uncharacterized protein n=1 Tax=Paraburkholderia ribeironis TaxID=1247936 RepID=A0A1N7RVX7_9BURK|nr:hypothetical protein BN2475_190140 [Paraburkholderia ribeironis]
MVVFYRGTGITQVSQLEGKRVAIGREGSGTRLIALQLLEANGIAPSGDTVLVPSDGLHGKSFLYRTLPFWLASIGDRTLVLLLPVAVLLFPAMRLVPALYRWRVRSRSYYGSLIAIERGALADPTDDERQQLFAQLDQIEASLNRLRMPLAYTDAFYVLREHVGFVRSRLTAGARQRSTA